MHYFYVYHWNAANMVLTFISVSAIRLLLYYTLFISTALQWTYSATEPCLLIQRRRKEIDFPKNIILSETTSINK